MHGYHRSDLLVTAEEAQEKSFEGCFYAPEQVSSSAAVVTLISSIALLVSLINCRVGAPPEENEGLFAF